MLKLCYSTCEKVREICIELDDNVADILGTVFFAAWFYDNQIEDQSFTHAKDQGTMSQDTKRTGRYINIKIRQRTSLQKSCIIPFKILAAFAFDTPLEFFLISLCSHIGYLV